MKSDGKIRELLRPEVLIALATLILGVLAYLRPPDPAHPARLDFLSKTISIPIWVAAIVVVGIVAVSAVIFRTFRKGTIVPENAKGRSGQSAHRPDNATDTEHQIPHPLYSIDALPDRSQLCGDAFKVNSSDKFTLHLTTEQHGDTKGLMLRISNEALRAISEIIVTIYTAQSYDRLNKDYRDGMEFNAVRIVNHGIVGASASGNPTWLVAKKDEMPHLFVGDSLANVLKWPPNDKSTFQRWRFKLAVMASTHAASAAQKAVPLSPIKLLIDIGWEAEKNEFSVEAAGTFTQP
jgi:hypothetical protein